MNRDAFKQVFASLKKTERENNHLILAKISICGKEYTFRTYVDNGEIFYQEAYGVLSYIDDTHESFFDVDSIDILSFEKKK